MRKTKAIGVFICCTIMSGCGLQMRSSKPLPKSLNPIYLSAEKPYSPVTTKLKAMLKSMNIAIKSSAKSTRFSLLITHDNFSTSRTDVMNATLPSSVSYSQTATLAIQNNNTKHIITSRSFGSSESVTLNANQLYMPSSDFEIKNTLNQEIVAQIYDWLTASNTKKLLNHAIK